MTSDSINHLIAATRRNPIFTNYLHKTTPTVTLGPKGPERRFDRVVKCRIPFYKITG